jgi:hypothetical protein
MAAFIPAIMAGLKGLKIGSTIAGVGKTVGGAVGLSSGATVGGAIGYMVKMTVFSSLVKQGMDIWSASKRAGLSDKERDHAIKLMKMETEQQSSTSEKLLELLAQQKSTDREYQLEDRKMQQDYMKDMMKGEQQMSREATAMALSIDPRLAVERLSPTNMARIFSERVLSGGLEKGRRLM